MSTKNLIWVISGLMALIQLLFVMDGEFITYLYAAASYVSLIFCFVLNARIHKSLSSWPFIVLIAYFALCIVSIIRGFGEAVNYWDWKQFLLNNVFIMLFPLISLIGSNASVTFNFLRSYLFLIPLGVIVFILSRFSENTDGFGRYMSPLCFFILMIPYLRKKYVLLILGIAVWSFFSDMEARSNMIRIVVAVSLCIISYLYKYCSRSLLKFFYIVIFFVPPTLFLTAYLNVFNVFSMDEYANVEVSVEGRDEENSDLLADTRTFIYQEQLMSLINRGNLLCGESASAGYESISFVESSLTSKGRAASEVGILNVIMYNGLIGGLLFSLLFFVCGYRCLRFANNRFAVSLAFFVAFRWLYSWVEEFTNYDLSYFFLWLMLGLCLDKELVMLKDGQIKLIVNKIFLFNYQKAVNENSSFDDVFQ